LGSFASDFLPAASNGASCFNHEGFMSTGVNSTQSVPTYRCFSSCSCDFTRDRAIRSRDQASLPNERSDSDDGIVFKSCGAGFIPATSNGVFCRVSINLWRTRGLSRRLVSMVLFTGVLCKMSSDIHCMVQKELATIETRFCCWRVIYGVLALVQPNRMRRREAQALYLSPGFGDFRRLA